MAGNMADTHIAGTKRQGVIPNLEEAFQSLSSLLETVPVNSLCMHLNFVNLLGEISVATASNVAAYTMRKNEEREPEVEEGLLAFLSSLYAFS
jgi:hypothetical protein